MFFQSNGTNVNRLTRALKKWTFAKELGVSYSCKSSWWARMRTHLAMNLSDTRFFCFQPADTSRRTCGENLSFSGRLVFEELALQCIPSQNVINTCFQLNEKASTLFGAQFSSSKSCTVDFFRSNVHTSHKEGVHKVVGPCVPSSWRSSRCNAFPARTRFGSDIEKNWRHRLPRGPNPLSRVI